MSEAPGHHGGSAAAACGAPSGAARAAAPPVDAAPEGWLTDAQAARLRARAAAAGTATIVEIGSFRGRSTVVLAGAAAPGASVVAIDPHAGSDRGPQEIGADSVRGDADHEAFIANLAAAGVSDRVRHVRKMSADALGEVDGPLAMLYVDGAHRFAPARDDIARWGALLAPGGTMLVHDAFSSIGVTGALLAECVGRGGWRYAGRTGSLAEYERLAAPLSRAARARDAARQLAQLPWFARNVLFKLLVLARLRPLAHRLGLPAGMHWPY